jgi:hypothetical protein
MSISVTSFGADPSGVADSGAAILAAKAAAEAAGDALLFPEGSYKSSVQLTLGYFEGEIICEGRVALINDNPANSPFVTFDGTGIAALRMRADGLNVYAGGAGVGVLFKNSSCSMWSNMTVRDVAGTAFRIEGDVLSTYDNVDVVERGHPFGIMPDFGFVLAETASVSSTTACTFINCKVEVAKVRGWYLYKANNNVWVGGTAEGLGHQAGGPTPALGVLVDAGCDHNHFDGFFMEMNAGGDLVDYGQFNRYTTCMFSSRPNDPGPYLAPPAVLIKSGAVGATFASCSAFSVNIEEGARAVHFAPLELMYDDPGAFVDNGEGTTWQTRAVKNPVGSLVALGQGTRFPNLENPDPNEFDWYREENNGTVALGGDVSNGSMTQTARFRYRRCGNRVDYDASITVTAISSLFSGIPVVRMTLPWIAAVESGATISYLRGFTLPGGCCQFVLYQPDGTAYARLGALKSDGTGTVWLDHTNYLGSGEISIVCHGSFQPSTSD